jgi:hypothetical protein
MEQPAAEQPMMQQTVGQHPVTEQPAFEQSFARENSVEEVRRTEFVPAVAVSEPPPFPETVIQIPQAPPAAPQPQAAPAWKMEPVALPSDMVMIETQAKPQTNHQEPEPQRPARTPRPRPQTQAIPEEPLQQVETGGKP